jgi:hypothetical protein
VRFPHREIRRLFADGDKASTPLEKGDKLAAIAKLLLETVPGVVFVDEKVLNDRKSVEVDIVFMNSRLESGFFFF